MPDQQLLLFNLSPPGREQYKDVLTDLLQSCADCRLGALLHPGNRGLIWKGNPLARIAAISEAPGDLEMERGLPLIGKSGQIFDKWCAFLQLDCRRDLLVTNICQCQPPKEKDSQSGKNEQRKPKDDEIDACFPKRALRLLRAMPNLEVVLCLGFVAAEALLGRIDPETGITAKSHENRWFTTSLLPEVAIYVMIHPSALMREPSPEKSGKVLEGLKQFKKEYLELHKVNEIVRQMEETSAQP